MSLNILTSPYPPQAYSVYATLAWIVKHRFGQGDPLLTLRLIGWCGLVGEPRGSWPVQIPPAVSRLRHHSCTMSAERYASVSSEPNRASQGRREQGGVACRKREPALSQEQGMNPCTGGSDGSRSRGRTSIRGWRPDGLACGPGDGPGRGSLSGLADLSRGALPTNRAPGGLGP